MSQPSNPKSPSNKNPSDAVKTADTNKPAADAAPVETAKPETTVAPAAHPAEGGGKSAEKVIISLSVTPKLAKQVRLLSKLEGVTISSLFIATIEREIGARLKMALAAITDE